MTLNQSQERNYLRILNLFPLNFASFELSFIIWLLLVVLLIVYVVPYYYI